MLVLWKLITPIRYTYIQISQKFLDQYANRQASHVVYRLKFDHHQRSTNVFSTSLHGNFVNKIYKCKIFLVLQIDFQAQSYGEGKTGETGSDGHSQVQGT